MGINLLAALAVSISNMVLGFIWYGPLFAKTWMKEVKLTEREIGNGPGIGYLITMIAAFIMGAVTTILVNKLGITQVIDGAALGALVGVGYAGTTFATNYIFARKSFKLFAIDAGYQTLAIILAGVIATLIR